MCPLWLNQWIRRLCLPDLNSEHINDTFWNMMDLLSFIFLASFSLLFSSYFYTIAGYSFTCNLGPT